MSREEHRCPRPCPARSVPDPAGRRAQPDPRAGGPPPPGRRPAAHPRRRDLGRRPHPVDRQRPQHPMAVLEVRDADDVVAAVRWAVDHGVQVTAQPTGHGAGDAFDQVLMLRTRGLDGIAVDVQRRTAWVGAGVKAGELLAELDGTGLTFLAGSNPDPTVVGMTITGGISWFGRAYGARRRQHRHRRARRRPRPPAPGQRHRGPGAVLGRARRRRRLRDHHPDGGRAAPRPGGVRRPDAVADRADGRGAPHLQGGHRGSPGRADDLVPHLPVPAPARDPRAHPRQGLRRRSPSPTSAAARTPRSSWRRSAPCPGWRWT